MPEEQALRRKKHRLPVELYAQPGAYFITICTHERRHTLGEVVEAQVHLSQAGRHFEESWLALPKFWDRLRLDARVVMPNHFHGILIIIPDDVSPSSGLLTPNIPRIVQALKASVTRMVNAAAGNPGQPVLQDDYYDHIVRDEEDLYRIREYIQNNPLAWHLDKENDQRQGLHPIYEHLGSFQGIPKSRWVP